ncbi:MAG: DUF2298 domain-containing protein [Candidatus Levyibacteriota bacterium]
MYPSDIHAVLVWWFVLFLFGVGFLPLTFRLFSSFFDKGYIFSKLIGVLLVGYIVFVLGAFRIAPFSVPVIIIVALVLAGGLYFFLPDRFKVVYILKQSWLTFAIEELTFLVILFTWAYVHSFAPDIHGLEKFMDYGFVNAFLRTEYLPPVDIWFPPATINYYYFGHLLTAMLTKLSNLPSALTFNLMLSTIVAFCFTETFSLGANLYAKIDKSGKISHLKLILSGILTACLVTFAGNLHVLYAFFKPYNTDNPVPMWQLPFQPNSFPNGYWYPNATRFIYHTIHEFPIYSWVVADLHGHVLDIPFVLLSISLLFSLLIHHTEQSREQREKIKKTFQINPYFLGFIGFVLSCMYMTNAWDGAIYWLLAMMVLLVIHWQKLPSYEKLFGKSESLQVIHKKNAKETHALTKGQWSWLRDLGISVAIVSVGLFIFNTPYNLFFNASAIVKGIGVLCAPSFLTHIGHIGPFLFEPNHCQRSYWWELLTLYGFFYFFVVAFSAFILRSKEHSQTDTFVLLLMILSTFLIIVPEFFYLKDIYPEHYRANTMFKLVFQAFIVLSICSGYVIVRLASSMENKGVTKRLLKGGFLVLTTMLVYFVMSYPFLAVRAYYNDFKNYQGLNGINYLRTLYPDDYAGIQWLNTNVRGQQVIVEAQGDSYTDYERISANTGLPTILGWTVHEWLWRGSYDVPAPRITEVKTIYETPDAQTANQILKKYDVRYVYVGTLEYQKYPNLQEAKFNQLGKIVFQHGSTRIYKLN